MPNAEHSATDSSVTLIGVWFRLSSLKNFFSEAMYLAVSASRLIWTSLLNSAGAPAKAIKASTSIKCKSPGKIRLKGGSPKSKFAKSLTKSAFRVGLSLPALATPTATVSGVITC